MKENVSTYSNTCAREHEERMMPMNIEVQSGLYAQAPDGRTSEQRSHRYAAAAGPRRIERRGLERDSDFCNADFERVSEDNGRTWGEWRDVYRESYERKGDDEIMTWRGPETYNPRHGHFVSLQTRRIFIDGHLKAYYRYWGKGEASYFDHCLLAVRRDGREECVVEPVKYEPGADYDPDRWRDPAHTDHNRACFGNGVDVLDTGEIVFAIEADVQACCRLLHRDIKEVFPSCPEIMAGMIVARGRFNETRGHYDLSFSRPVVISDLKSSRGVNEPDAVMLPSGRILAVFRGSNVRSKPWRTRIEPGAPAYRWHCWSDDGGRTFTDPMPWHFDNREVFYSPASIAKFVRSIRNGRLYWIGNITDHTAYGNQPRYPLIAVEVNERGLPIKESLAVIDTRREGDRETVEFSNFSILQDRETGRIELYLSKIGQSKEFPLWGDCWRYLIDVPAPGGAEK